MTRNEGGIETESLILYPVPALVAVLLNQERRKGAPLTEEEVTAIRDGCVTIAMPADVARQIDEARGYADIDPEDCWMEWQRIRETLTDE